MNRRKYNETTYRVVRNAIMWRGWHVISIGRCRVVRIPSSTRLRTLGIVRRRGHTVLWRRRHGSVHGLLVGTLVPSLVHRRMRIGRMGGRRCRRLRRRWRRKRPLIVWRVVRVSHRVTTRSRRWKSVMGRKVSMRVVLVWRGHWIAGWVKITLVTSHGLFFYATVLSRVTANVLFGGLSLAGWYCFGFFVGVCGSIVRMTVFGIRPFTSWLRDDAAQGECCSRTRRKETSSSVTVVIAAAAVVAAAVVWHRSIESFRAWTSHRWTIGPHRWHGEGFLVRQVVGHDLTSVDETQSKEEQLYKREEGRLFSLAPFGGLWIVTVWLFCAGEVPFRGVCCVRKKFKNGERRARPTPTLPFWHTDCFKAKLFSRV